MRLYDGQHIVHLPLTYLEFSNLKLDPSFWHDLGEVMKKRIEAELRVLELVIRLIKGLQESGADFTPAELLEACNAIIRKPELLEPSNAEPAEIAVREEVGRGMVSQ
jgi:hypothetical protein